MAGTQTWRRVWVLGLLVVVLVLLLLPSATWGIHGEYFTQGYLNNKRLPVVLESEATGSKEDCQRHCAVNDKCNAFAVSDFEVNCYLYKKDETNQPVKFNTYKLYVLLLNESDGYYVNGIAYYKLHTDRLNAIRAAQICQEEGGQLAKVESAEVNELLQTRLEAHNAGKAYIGVSDMKSEEDWRYSDGTKMVYSNWERKWPSEERDCAFMILNSKGFWEHSDCWDKHFFFCQIPMF